MTGKRSGLEPLAEGSTAPEAKEAVRLENVWKVYGTERVAVTALRGVNVSFPSARLTAVMGPSGSGKTTLLQCAAGLDEPTSGRVHVGETTITGIKERHVAKLRRTDIGFVFQQFNLLPALTALENITVPLRLGGHEIDERWLEEILERTGISELVDRHPDELSGGEQQRVSICRALLSRPHVIFADEPTGALDGDASRKILTLLREAVTELKQAVVLVTHDPVAAAYADTVLIFRNGEVVDHIDAPTVSRLSLRLSEQE